MSEKNIYESVRDDSKKFAKGAIWIVIIGGLLIALYMTAVIVAAIVLLLGTGVFALSYYLWSRNTY
jgi:hypothetical protein